MLKKLRGRLGRKGQGMTEYIIIVALVAVVAIGLVTVFGDKIKSIFNKSNDAMGTIDTEINGTGTGQNRQATP